MTDSTGRAAPREAGDAPPKPASAQPRPATPGKGGGSVPLAVPSPNSGGVPSNPNSHPPSRPPMDGTQPRVLGPPLEARSGPSPAFRNLIENGFVLEFEIHQVPRPSRPAARPPAPSNPSPAQPESAPAQQPARETRPAPITPAPSPTDSMGSLIEDAARPRPVREFFAAPPVAVERGDDPIQPEVLPDPGMDRAPEKFGPRPEAGRFADDPARIDLAVDSEEPKNPLFNHMAAFYGSHRQAAIEGFTNAALDPSGRIVLRIEYKPVEVIPPQIS